MKWLALILCLTAVTAQAEESPEQEHARRLLLSAYVEAGDYCETFPSGTYVTHIGGIRIHADCKIRSDFVTRLTAEGKKLEDVADGLVAAE